MADLEKIYKKFFDESGNMKEAGTNILKKGMSDLKSSGASLTEGPKTLTEKGFFQPKSIAAKELATKAAKATRIGKIAAGVAAAGLAAKQYLKSKMNKEEPEGKMGGGMMKKYSEGKSVKLSPKQMKIARMAPPPNKITGEDFKAMKANVGKSVKGYGQARKSGMGLEDENVSLGKGSDYIKDLL